ncbi:hypothetical protein D5R93_06735 [Actinomyces lilanjuaniae]|uniref:Uncharacterized protein n=1 Tax=Actinomyces lilanjuaniae TaxID=2321394 RepID=A0ABM6Z3H6_9ACTO|nr:hypothetical protein [Actinomyces lilanjuaniae]AYD89807.1 hypothetical protein D5R93_06735 [Actinomyces lilanjuaniae]
MTIKRAVAVTALAVLPLVVATTASAAPYALLGSAHGSEPAAASQDPRSSGSTSGSWGVVGAAASGDAASGWSGTRDHAVYTDGAGPDDATIVTVDQVQDQDDPDPGTDPDPGGQQDPGPDPGTGTDPGTDPDPGGQQDPGPDPGTGTDPGTDPDPGGQQDPGPDPGTGTDPGTDPDPGGQQDPGPDPGTGTDPGTQPGPGTGADSTQPEGSPTPSAPSSPGITALARTLLRTRPPLPRLPKIPRPRPLPVMARRRPLRVLF